MDSRSEGNLQDLGLLVRQERVKRIGALERAADAGGLNHNTWRRIERGLSVRSGSYSGIDRAFNLPEGSTRDAVLGGAGLARLLRALAKSRAEQNVTTDGAGVPDSLYGILDAIVALPDEALRPAETGELLVLLRELHTQVRDLSDVVQDLRAQLGPGGQKLGADLHQANCASRSSAPWEAVVTG